MSYNIKTGYNIRIFEMFALILCFFFLLVLYMISYSTGKVSMIVITVLLFFLLSWVVSFLKFREYFPLGIFSFMLFIFTFSSILVEWIDQGDLPYIYTPTTLESINLIAISLITFWISYAMFNKLFTHKINSWEKLETDFYSVEDKALLGRLMFIITIFSGIFFTILNIEAVIFVFRYGYVSYYANFKTQLPVLFRKLANSFEMFFWIYIFTIKMNSKKRNVVLFLYILNLIIILILGKRGPLILGIAMLLLYKFKMLVKNPQNLRSFRKWILIIITISIIASPVILTGLYLYGYTRVKKEAAVDSLFDGIKMFFLTQGNSGLQHINYVVNLYDRINKHNSYLLSYIINEVKRSPLALLLGFYREYTPHTYEAAWESGYWGYQFAYLNFTESYLEGSGAGSCYIAEAYLDMKIAGVLIVNVIFSLFINYVIYGPIKNTVIIGFLFYPLRDVLYAPRSAAFVFLSRIVNSYNLMALVIILILYTSHRSKATRKIKLSLEKGDRK